MFIFMPMFVGVRGVDRRESVISRPFSMVCHSQSAFAF